MTSHFRHGISDEECLLDLLRLIVTRHPGAQTAVADAFKHSPHLANAYLTFNFRENGSKLEQECHCHYEHEYMTYITDNEPGFDFESFSHVAKNVMRGHCRHVLYSPDADFSPVSVSPTKPYLQFGKSELNLRRHSVNFDLSGSRPLPEKRKLAKRRSSSSLKSLELNDSNRGLTGMSRRSSTCASLRSLSEEVQEVQGQTQSSLIHAAAAVGNGALFAFLLKKSKVSIEQLGKFQLSPLHLAILKNKMCYLKQIILRPETYLCNRAGLFSYATTTVDPEGGSSTIEVRKLSLLGLCIKMDDLDTMQDLIETGFISDCALERALCEAVELDSYDATEILLLCGVRPTVDIMKNGTSKSVDVFESIFKRFRKDFKVYAIQHPQYVTRELLMPAILTRNVGVVTVLLQNGSPVDGKGFYTPLTCAVLENQPEVVKLLLEQRADKTPEMHNYNLLDISTCLGFTECTETLRSHGLKRKAKAIKNTVPCNLLMGMAKKFDLPQDQIKLQRYADHKRHTQGHDEDTVLHVAIKAKLSRRFVHEILKTGSNVNARNKKQETPLMCAVSKENFSDPDVILELLYFNPVLELCDKSGKSTLMHAISRDQIQRRQAEETYSNNSYVGSSSSINNANNNSNSNNNSNNNNFDQTPSIAPLLLDCGYNVKFDDIKKPHATMFALRTVWRDLAATIGCGRDGMYVQHNPKGLQSRCREVVRRSHPGIKLHRFLEHMKVPQDVTNFVLMKEMLKVED